MINYENIQKLVNKANSRLRRLEKFTGRDVSWSGKQLQSKLDNEKINAWSSGNRIKISKDMTETQLYRIQQATEKFLNSEASKIRYIKKNIKETKEGFKANFEVDEAEAEALYQMFEEDLTKWATRYIDPSVYFGLIEEAKEYNFSYATFEKRFLEAAKIQNDLDVTEKIQSLYKKYINEDFGEYK